MGISRQVGNTSQGKSTARNTPPRVRLPLPTLKCFCSGCVLIASVGKRRAARWSRKGNCRGENEMQWTYDNWLPVLVIFGVAVYFLMRCGGGGHRGGIGGLFSSRSGGHVGGLGGLLGGHGDGHCGGPGNGSGHDHGDPDKLTPAASESGTATPTDESPPAPDANKPPHKGC